MRQLILLAIILQLSSVAYGLDVPVVVTEALPAGVSGIARSEEIVTVGLPLSDNDAITSTNQLGFSVVPSAQFRITAWYPSGNAKWVLVDFPASVAAGESVVVGNLVTGKGNFGGPNLAEDGTNITVNTGGATFVIKKTGFNIFDSVTVGNTNLVTSGNRGRIEAKGLDGVIYSSNNDMLLTSVIEENGPVRATVKVMGSLTSSFGVRLIDYTLRLHFFKNKSYVKGQIFLRNADKKFPTSAIIKSAELIVPITASGSKTVLFSLNNTAVSRILSSDDTSYLYQGYNVNPSQKVPLSDNCNYWDPPVPGTCYSGKFIPTDSYSGVEIVSGSDIVNALGKNSDLTQGYASFNNSFGVGVNVALRWMSSYWPTGFEFKENGDTSIEFYSKRNGGKPEKYPFVSFDSNNGAFGHHERREVIWDFHTKSVNEVSTLYLIQYPLVARAPLDRYMQTNAIMGQSGFVTEDEQNKFFTDFGRTPPSLANPSMDEVYRAWQWTLGGGRNQTDFPLQDLVDFIRTGKGGFYLLGQQRTQWNADTQIPRSDNFSIDKVWAGTDPLPTSKGVVGSFVDLDHSHIVSTPFYYFISGDEAIRDAFLDYGEYLQMQNNQSVYAIPSLSNKDLRSVSRKLRNMALTYEFSCQVGTCYADAKTTLEKAINAFMDMRDDSSLGTSSPVGRNMDRGYFWWDSFLSAQEGGYRVEHSLYVIPIWFEALWQLQRVMKDTSFNFNRQLDFEDFMSGLSRWILDEWLTYYPNGLSVDGTFKYKHDYNYKLDISPTAYPDTHYLYYTAGRAAQWAFQHTGNISYLNKGGWLLWESSEGGAAQRANGVMREASELQDQALMHMSINAVNIPVWKDVVVDVLDNGGGAYVLSWKVPAGAQQYQIKYSARPIVDWLWFDKETRKYSYEPTLYTPFFAAKNIANNPIPATEGTVQTLKLTGFDLSQKFSMKCLVAPSYTSTWNPASSWKPNLKRIQ